MSASYHRIRGILFQIIIDQIRSGFYGLERPTA